MDTLSMTQIDQIVEEYLFLDTDDVTVRNKLLWLGARSERFYFSHKLALRLKAIGKGRAARLLLDRAFDLWDGEPNFIDSYLEVLRSERDADRLRFVARRAGIIALEKASLVEGLKYFNLSQYALPATGGGDSYRYDQEILSVIDALPQSRPDRIVDPTKACGKTRIAYITYGAAQRNSVLVRLLTDFVRHHDGDTFEVAYFSCDVLSDQRKESELLFSSLGAKLFTSDCTDDALCIRNTETRLREFAPDLLVGVAVLADYRNYYLFSRFPDLRRVVLCYGPPAQYVPPTADFAIGATWHPMLDSPIDGAVVEIEVTLPVRPALTSTSPAELEHVPDEAIVIVVAGRSEKFADIRYWTALIDVLERCSSAYLVAVGLERRPEFWDCLIAETAARDRVITVGWVDNYRDFILRANIVVDTFPSGGGLTVLDAMAFGLPVISFQDDYLQPFDQVNWSLGEELLPSSDLIVPRDDLSKLTSLILMLVNSPNQRKHYGELCRHHAHNTRGNPARMVERIEVHYKQLLQRASSSRVQRLGAPCLTCNTGVLAVLLSRVRADMYKIKRLIVGYCASK